MSVLYVATYVTAIDPPLLRLSSDVLLNPKSLPRKVGRQSKYGHEIPQPLTAFHSQIISGGTFWQSGLVNSQFFLMNMSSGNYAEKYL